jgi:putative transcriptional regulator
MSKLGKRLIEGLNEAIAIAEKNPAALRTMTIEAADVVEIRKSLKLSQDKFAERFRLSAATVRDWEHGRRKPDASANNYLLMIKHAPEVVEKVLSGAYGGEA